MRAGSFSGEAGARCLCRAGQVHRLPSGVWAGDSPTVGRSLGPGDVFRLWTVEKQLLLMPGSSSLLAGNLGVGGLSWAEARRTAGSQGLPTGAVPLLELERHAGAPFCLSLWENKSGEAGVEVVAWPGLGFKGCPPVL